jgi:rod shape-determining protein MreC
METFLSRYRNLTVLLLLLMAQLLLLAYQVKTKEEVRLIRIWAVTAVTPVARVMESVRAATSAVFTTLFMQRSVQEENEHLKTDLSKLRLENQFLKTELSTADRAAVLLAFRKQTPSKTLAARVIGTGTGANARVVYLDRGSTDGIRKGMAVITPDGIAGKVVSSYPTASLVILASQQGFAAGVISQKNRARGTLKGVGTDSCEVESIREGQLIEDGEWLYTSGDDRIFPKGLVVGQAQVIKRQNGPSKEIRVVPAGLKGNLEEVLIVVEGVHGEIPPPTAPSSSDYQMLPPPPPAKGPASDQPTTRGMGQTDADRLRDKYRKLGESQGITFGEPSYKVPDFNKQPASVAPPKAPTAPREGAPPKQ